MRCLSGGAIGLVDVGAALGLKPRVEFGQLLLGPLAGLPRLLQRFVGLAPLRQRLFKVLQCSQSAAAVQAYWW